MVHLLPHWNFQGMEGEEIRVSAYTNAPSCELFLNGVSQGKRSVEQGGHAEWQVAYESGEIKAVAYDEKGEIVAQDKRETTGKAEKLCLKQEMIDSEENGEKIAIISCYTKDSQGKEVPNATPFVRFHLEGNGVILGTGSGTADHTPPSAVERKMVAGKIAVCVKLGKVAESVKLFAFADGLESEATVIS